MKKAVFVSLLTALAGGTSAFGVAYAEAPAAPAQRTEACEHGPRAQRFEKLDINKDGRVSRDEMLGKASERFDRADANKDGTLTAEERAAAHKRFAEEHFKKADKNGDGVLTADELPPHFAKMLGKLDTNKDGKLTQPELAAGHEQFTARFAKKHPQAKEPKSRSELLAHVSARFDKLDANKDGSLSPEELRKEHFRGHRVHWRRHATTT
jgi:Ca2+-binding EF-hand superfamily protein